jgi:SAM-dependent methyltransferase
MHDTLLKRWVKQPPAAPNIQYLRDAERTAAHDLLDAYDSVLDVASESTLTEELGGTVTRVDFSASASEYADSVIGDAVREYAVTEPGDPALPFPEDAFDVAVSIGPFDWRFLDVDALIDELHRVLDGGPLVFSVLTPRSPYAASDRNRLRYYEPAVARDLVSPEWHLSDRALLFQYPPPIHGLLNRLPAKVQTRFVSAAETASDLLDRKDRWDLASCLVLAARPMPFVTALDSALECLYRPVTTDGFWDPDDGKIVRALHFESRDGGLVWTPEDAVEWRYAPFALAGTMRWRASPLGDDRYDDRIERALAHFREAVADPDRLAEMPSYGIGTLTAAFSVAANVFGEEPYEQTARDLYVHSREAFAFEHAEDSLLAYGWSYLYEETGDPEIERDVEDAIWSIAERLDTDDVFVFDNHTTRRHQNQMYTLWGLCKAIEVTGQTGFLDNAARVLDRTIERRMLDSGAFIWEDVPRSRRVRREIERRLGRAPPHWDLLYACHQTFFVTAVAHYYRAGGDRNYDGAVRRAMEWIHATNDWNVDLTEVSGLGVPMRGMTVRGRIGSDQRFKGAYEVGAGIMALTELVGGTFSTRQDRAVDRGAKTRGPPTTLGDSG